MIYDELCVERGIEPLAERDAEEVHRIIELLERRLVLSLVNPRAVVDVVRTL